MKTNRRFVSAFAFAAFLPLVMLSSGCVYALRTSSSPTDVKLHVIASQPQQHSVRIGTENPVEHLVAENGKVAFTVPRVSGGCDVYVFGVIKTCDGSAEKVPVIEVRRSDKVVRKFSLAQIAKLPTDETGYSLIKIRD